MPMVYAAIAVVQSANVGNPGDTCPTRGLIRTAAPAENGPLMTMAVTFCSGPKSVVDQLQCAAWPEFTPGGFA
jgi:hypothetical protein